LGRENGNWHWYALGGVFCALAHLTRADGLLLLVVLLIVALWPFGSFSWRHSLTAAAVGLAAYLLVMLPWFVRNMAEIGTPLPLGGTQAIWLRGYDELVNYPAGANARDFLNWGMDHILQSRWDALRSNFGTFIAVETWVIMSPFVLIGLWKRRKTPFLLGLIFYAVGLHLVMTFVFAYPGYRGGLFHSSSALLPFWAILGLLGLDDTIDWMAKTRRWQRAQAQLVFNAALIVLVVVLSLSMFARRVADWNNNGAFYKTLAADLPLDAVLMINDPAALYYHTTLAGVVIPNAEPEVVPEIAARYGVTHLVLDVNRTQPFNGLFMGQETRPFLRLYSQTDDVRVFEITAGEKDE
jgi:4-amino-4-deoxy-L-arabinose transferase-like glycosyltransferase